MNRKARITQNQEIASRDDAAFPDDALACRAPRAAARLRPELPPQLSR